MHTMKRSTKVFGVLFLGLLTMAVVAVAGEVKTHLNGYEETPLTISSTGSGEFKAKINFNGTAINYELTYRDLESEVTQAHIHFGRPGISGGIVLFLCTNLNNAPSTVPTPQTCPTAPAAITGTLTEDDVIASSNGQGIDAGAVGFAETLEAIQASATYVNVHTMAHPSGEIRGRLRDHGPDAH